LIQQPPFTVCITFFLRWGNMIPEESVNSRPHFRKAGNRHSSDQPWKYQWMHQDSGRFSCLWDWRSLNRSVSSERPALSETSQGAF
jgi:hypothetical protein